MVNLTVVMFLHAVYIGKLLHTFWVESFPIQVGFRYLLKFA